MLFFAQVPTVIAHEHDKSFPAAGVLFELLNESSDLSINEGDRSLVGADRGIPFIVRDNVLVIAQSVMKWFVSVRPGQALGKFRHVSPIVHAFWFRWPAYRIKRKLVEPGFGHLQWSMGPKEADGHEERFFGDGFPLFRCPGSDFVVPHFLVRNVERVAIVGGTHRVEIVFPFGRLGIGCSFELGVPSVPRR